MTKIRVFAVNRGVDTLLSEFDGNLNTYLGIRRMLTEMLPAIKNTLDLKIQLVKIAGASADEQDEF